MSATSHFATLKRDEERFLSYTLFELLPPHHLLVADTFNKTITEVEDSSGAIIFVEQQVFTYDEFAQIIAILTEQPYYCPLANLLLAKERRTLAYQQEQLAQADEAGWMDELMRPIRNILSRARIKMRLFDLEITSMTGLGYTLTPYSARIRRSVR
jgi:hypothetical protein